jgi:hypothetical protein
MPLASPSPLSKTVDDPSKAFPKTETLLLMTFAAVSLLQQQNPHRSPYVSLSKSITRWKMI